MFKYPTGTTIMNGVLTLIGGAYFLIGLLIILAGSFIDITSYVDLSDIQLMVPDLYNLLTSGSIFIGLMIIIASFPILMFADTHAKSVQTNKMMKKMYQKIK